MRLSLTNDNQIRIDFNYNSEIIELIKSIRGWRYHPDPLGSFWTIPIESVSIARKTLELTEGSFWPDAKGCIARNAFKDVCVEIKADRVKLEGPHDQINYLEDSINSVCAYEHTVTEWNDQLKKQVQITTNIVLAENIYDKPTIKVIKFPGGLHRRIVEFVQFLKTRKTIIHPMPEAPKPELDLRITGVTPRDYQAEALSVTDKTNRATLVMATGAGKTMLSAMITEKLKLNTLFLTYSTDLMNQTVMTYERLFGTTIGRIGGSRFQIEPITVATIQTLYKCWERQDERWSKVSAYLERVGLCFIDEGHQLGAETILKVSRLADAYYTYALTATPFREDGKELCIEAGAGPTIQIVPETVLVEQGWVLPVKVEMIPVKHYPVKFKKYSKIYQREVIDDWDRNRAIVRAVRHYKNKQVLVLVKDVQGGHGQKIADQLSCDFIHGKTKTADRAKAIEKLKNKEVSVLVGTSILRQGIDIPEVEVLVLAHPGSSMVDLIQRIGRARRPDPNNPDKTHAIIVDIYDYNESFNDAPDILRQQAEKRLSLYRACGYEVEFQSERNITRNHKSALQGV
jgi:superfamily II DNA or RNA helicase